MSLTLEDIDTLIDNISEHAKPAPLFYISKNTYKRVKHAVAIGKHYARTQKLNRRQRRAAQRRHNRGVA